jgi:hypothetical protein
MFLRLLSLLAVSVLTAEARPNEMIYLSGTGSDDPVDWEFFCTKGRRSGEWTTIPVPSNWELQGFGSFNYGHDIPKADEQGEYRHRFEVPAAWCGRQVLIVFEGAMTDTEVRINGRPAGPVHQGGFYQFEHDISGLVEFGGENLLEVTVSKVSANESVERAERLADFWVFGGIFRPVFLMARPQRHIDWSAIDARADGEFSARVHLGGALDADALTLELQDSDGGAVAPPVRMSLEAGQEVAVLETRAAAVQPWSDETPRLYQARIRLMKSGEVIHETTERFGFRTIEMRPGDGFYLNGRKIRFKGVNRHCFWPDSGRAVNRKISYDDARLIKEMNMNAVRMAHYPPDKHFLEACDELGLLVINELTGWHDAYDTTVGRKLVTSMIRRDVNHPSILIWSNGNEGGHNFELVADYPRLDPQRRQVIQPTPSWEGPTTFNGVDTAHYPTYEDHLKRLAGDAIYLPTEFLHGLYDGGAGAGLFDFWQAIKSSPVGAGGFIWALTDEGVARGDRGGRIDTDGNHAPDGILGPYREKSGSFETIRELWSPVQLALAPLAQDFDGRIAVANEYLFTNLKQCRFEWQWADFALPGESGERVKTSGSIVGPDVAPGTDGEIRIELPRDWRERDLLLVTAIAPDGARLFTWSQAVRGPQRYREAHFEAGEGGVVVSERDRVLTLEAGAVVARFDLVTGHLLGVRRGGDEAALTDGPRFVPKQAAVNYLPVAGVSASAEQAPHLAAHAVDGEATTRWSASGEGVSITLDLGELQEISAAEIFWQDGNQRRFRFTLETSGDQGEWTRVFAGESREKSGAESYVFPVVRARYLRLTGNGNSRNAWTSIHEIRIPSAAAAKSAVVTHAPSGSGHRVQARLHHANFCWEIHPSGWLQLDWQMEGGGPSEYAGITFDHPEAATLGKHWIGRGPHRVWQNRMHGPRLGAFSDDDQDPEFKGFFAEMHRLELLTRGGKLVFLTDRPELFARIHTPHPGDQPMRATAAFPEGDLSFLHVIPAIGTKFRTSQQLGPQGALKPRGGTQSGRIYLRPEGP